MSPEDSAEKDAKWDAFLQVTPLGQFQQSSSWARMKALDGWSAVRRLVNPARVEEGGFQLLWKNTRWGRIGYISKGPVLAIEEPEYLEAVWREIKNTARQLRLVALIVQPPDESCHLLHDMMERGFSRTPVPGVIRATAHIDLGGGTEAVMSRVSRQARKEARQAVKRGVVFRRGDRNDLGRFFELMAETCRRQGTRPNPARLEVLQALWDAFQPHALLGLAIHNDEVQAGLLMIGYGHRLTFWKKGSASGGSSLHVNSALNVEAFSWGGGLGYTLGDFGGVDPNIAQALLEGETMTEEQRQGRHMFVLRLGATPKLLPSAHLLVLNPVVRTLYHLATRIPSLERTLMRKFSVG
jgi:hypothetical protein